MRCCNVIEQSDLSAVPCEGTMIWGWPEFVCDTCKSRCGALAHPNCQKEDPRESG